MTVTVYGLSRPESVKRLIVALAEVPCYPRIIFKIDRVGKLLGVINQHEDGRVLYVQVLHWGNDSGRLPDIGWTADAPKLGRGVKQKSKKCLMRYTSGVRTRGMRVSYSGKAHRDIGARMTLRAS